MDIQKQYSGMMEAFNSVYDKTEKEVLSEETLEEKKIATGTGKKVMPSAKERSALAKRARAGKDIGNKGKGFKAVAAKAAKRYGSKEAGERVAAAAMFKQQAAEEVQTDLFDYLLEYLVVEGYADTNKAAIGIMANMSEEWKQSILLELTPLGVKAAGAVDDQRRGSTRDKDLKDTRDALDKMKAYPNGFPGVKGV